MEGDSLQLSSPYCVQANLFEVVSLLFGGSGVRWLLTVAKCLIS